MRTKKPQTLSFELALFYSALAAFSLGIAIQQIMLCFFALFQLLVGIVYGVRMGTLFMRGRRTAVAFLLITTICTVVAQHSFPTEESTHIHWAIGGFWVVAPAIALRADWKRLHLVMLALSVPGLLYSIYWLLQPDEILYALKVGFKGYPRASGFLSNPITYSEGLVTLACWTLSRLNFGTTNPREGKWLQLHVGISLLVILFSRVRAGLVGFVALFLINVLLVPRFRKIGASLVIGIPLLFFLVTTVFPFNSESLVERLELARNSVVLFQENPIFGIGPNKFNKVVDGVMLTQHPHNTLLGIATEFGILGLAAYLAFMFALGRMLYRLLKHHRDSELTWVVRALFFSFVSYHLFGLFDYNYADSELLIIHALQWGLVAHLAARLPRNKHS